MRSRKAAIVVAALGLAVAGTGLAGTGLAAPGAGATSVSAAPTGTCGAEQWVASWAASPTDASSFVDPSLGIIPERLTRQTLRTVITPHLSGSSARIHLSNRFGTSPLTFAHVTAARQRSGAAIGTPVEVTFGGSASVTVPAGQEIVSDPVALAVETFAPLTISMYLPATTSPPNRHWNANATSYYTRAGVGDLTTQTSDSRFTEKTLSWFYVSGLDVQASARSVVAFGDSITDGFVGGSPVSIPADKSVADKNGRYPDYLQRRVNAAGLAVSVVNAGIGSNQLLGTLISFAGPSGLSRFQADALDIPGVAGVLVLEGINDLGLGNGVTPQQITDAYTELITKAHAAGLKIWLGTITPAANAIVDGTFLAPNSENYRQQINTWVRTQTLADGVVDFDAAVRDPAKPSQLLPAYASPDNLHPSLAGYQKMAEAVSLDLLATTTC
ncbi:MULTISPECIES: GDSL-type esterase/lipase family protein [unclassified Frankia]|uniref:GDSL-type esterase/lipase family protein n=1 Tax=unclassified Frankia TaxID=2632575 RepID=UPI001F25A3EC|nr:MULTISPECIES: GDSL-type esterase/lipase family protein [unclassified Frankia]